MAFEIATSGRPGPVLIDIPMDVQKQEIVIDNDKKYEKIPNQQLINIDNSKLENLFIDLKNAKRPLILAGGGITSSCSIELFRKFVHTIKIPVVNSLMATDVLSYDNPIYLNQHTNWVFYILFERAQQLRTQDAIHCPVICR